MNLPIFFVATYSKTPMWGACVRSSDGVRFARLDKRASAAYLPCIQFDLDDLTQNGKIKEPFKSDWREATKEEVPNIMKNLGYLASTIDEKVWLIE